MQGIVLASEMPQRAPWAVDIAGYGPYRRRILRPEFPARYYIFHSDSYSKTVESSDVPRSDAYPIEADAF
jgi:hypothetical protein